MVSKRWMLALVAVTLIGGGLRARPALAPNPYQSLDERGYVSVAIGVADSGRYGRESLHWPPGAPLAFAAAARLDGRVVRGAEPDIPAAYAVQWLAGTALIPLAFALAVLLGGGPRAGLAAAAIVATYPPLIAVTGDLLSEPLGALWLTAAFVALAAARQPSKGVAARRTPARRRDPDPREPAPARPRARARPRPAPRRDPRRRRSRARGGVVAQRLVRRAAVRPDLDRRRQLVLRRHRSSPVAGRSRAPRRR